MGIVGQHDKGKDEHKVADQGPLADVHIAVEPDMIADPAVPLNVGEGADLKLRAGNRVLADGDMMAGAQTRAEAGAGVEDAVRPDQRAGTDAQLLSAGQRRRMADLAKRPDLASGADMRPGMDDGVSPDRNARFDNDLWPEIVIRGAAVYLGRHPQLLPEIHPPRQIARHLYGDGQSGSVIPSGSRSA